jgi:hypothetical protein
MTKPRQFDAFSATVYGDREVRTRAQRWLSWKRTGLPVTAAIAVIVVIAVITDLPTHQSLAGQRVDATGLISEVNSGLKPCVFSLQEANKIFGERQAGELSPGDRGRVPSLLADDAGACSFTSDNINNLSGIEEPGTGAGRFLSLVVGDAMTWTTSDALGAIDDMILITHRSHSARAAVDLHQRNTNLAADRQSALKALAQAESYLKGSLPSLLMPAITLSKP